MIKPDKVAVLATYDVASGACTSLEIKMNYDGISREELIEAIRVVFHPAALADPYADTHGHRELGETAVIPAYQSNGEYISPNESTTRLTITFPQK
jgi:hypothetical protein